MFHYITLPSFLTLRDKTEGFYVIVTNVVKGSGIRSEQIPSSMTAGFDGYYNILGKFTKLKC